MSIEERARECARELGPVLVDDTDVSANVVPFVVDAFLAFARSERKRVLDEAADAVHATLRTARNVHDDHAANVARTLLRAMAKREEE